MLFNSHIYIFLFLPLVIYGSYAVSRYTNNISAKSFLILASLVFYGWWNIKYLPLLVGSIVLNWFFFKFISVLKPHRGGQMAVLISGVLINLCILGFFKYADFFRTAFDTNLGASFQLTGSELPLAISFFTFQQIAFLVDEYRQETSRKSFRDYAFFVSFFPQLIAGPIVLQREILPQIAGAWKPIASPQSIAIGLMVFSIGLAKKVLIADTVGEQADVFFAAIERGEAALFFSSWLGSILFSLQIYFDFSGYSDMAVGGALMLNIRLPINFNSPYKATSIIDFWRRWHMTLSRFLKEYLYIPLGGNRHGRLRGFANILLVMGLGGFWHGAGWAFVFWGLIHGGLIVINHLWRIMLARFAPSNNRQRLYAFASWVLTLVAVTAAWVPFRTGDLTQAVHIWRAMFGFEGISISPLVLSLVGDFATSLQSTLTLFGLRYDGFFGSIWEQPIFIVLIAAAGLSVSWFLPNSNELAGYSGLTEPSSTPKLRVLTGRKRDAVLTGALLGISSLHLWGADVFIYFQF